MAQWARDPRQSEENLFDRYATEKLGLKGQDVAKFRKLCLLSADAVLRGKTSTYRDVSPWWSRDDGINCPALPADSANRRRVLDQKTEAVQLWEQIVALARAINFPDARTRDYVVISSQYGLHLYRIYQAVFELQALGVQGDKKELRRWLDAYDRAWADYRALPAQSQQCATLYHEKSAPKGAIGLGIEKAIPGFRKAADARRSE